MNARTTTLENGLTVVSHNMEHVETVSLGMWTKAGARDEADHENGLAHLLEHMAFKGTKNRSAFEIAAEIEAAGGDMNASTSMETTAYYARVLRNDWQLALDVISDIIMNPVFGADDLALEKGVILQEIASAQETPDDLVFDLVQQLAWPNHSLGRDILGTPDTVRRFSADNLAAYRAKHYTPSRMVLSAAGRVDHDELVDAANQRLSGLERGEGIQRTTPAYAGGDAACKRPLDQVHQVMAFSTPGYHDDDVYGIHLLASILGGGMSSRLFQEIRERRGLCYSTFAHVSAFADTGLMQVYAGTAPDRAAEFCKVASDVLLASTQDIEQAELDRARAQLKASLVMSLESPSSRADQIARQFLAYGKVPDVADILARVDAVSTDDVKRLAGATFNGASLSRAAVGDTSLLAQGNELAARFA